MPWPRLQTLFAFTLTLPLSCTRGEQDGDKCTAVLLGDMPPPGTVPNDGDCNDADPNTFPGAAPLDDPDACMQDEDGDDHGDVDPQGGGGLGPTSGSDACDDNPFAFTEVACRTCADADADAYWAGCDVYPDPNSAPDDPDLGGDEFADCDDDEKSTFPGSAPKDDPNACMKDADDDDFGDDFDGTAPPPGVAPGSDCDDVNDHTFPGSAPLDDPSACMQDDDDDHGDTRPDNDGVTPGTDCFDANANLNPSRAALMTAPVAIGPTANISTIVDNGNTYDQVQYRTFDVSGYLQWRIESMTANPLDSKVYGWLDDENGRGLVEIDYCSDAAPKPPLKLNKRVCGISFMGDGRLFGVDYSLDQLIEFATTGEVLRQMSLKLDGSLLNIGADCGMTYDCYDDRLLLADSSTGGLFALDVETGAATLLTFPGVELGAGLALDTTKKELLTCLGNDFYALALGDFALTQPNPLNVSSINDLEFLPLCE